MSHRITVYWANVRCLCGREHSIYANAVVTCGCGVSLRVDCDGETLTPVASVPDGYNRTGTTPVRQTAEITHYTWGRR